jgi:hypothetical protein
MSSINSRMCDCECHFTATTLFAMICGVHAVCIKDIFIHSTGASLVRKRILLVSRYASCKRIFKDLDLIDEATDVIRMPILAFVSS